MTNNGQPLDPDVDAEMNGDRFLKIVNHVSRQNINMCWHCWTCGGGFPFAAHMDLLPNQVIRLIQMGRGEDALGCNTIWLCVGCHTCSSQYQSSIGKPQIAMVVIAAKGQVISCTKSKLPFS